MKNKKPTPFEQHVQEWRNSKRMGMSLLRIEDIDPKDMAKVAAEAFSRWSMLETEEEKHEAYVQVLHSYGIMCPHPQAKRLYEGFLTSPVPTGDYRWYDCGVCGCAVLNEFHFRSIREKEDSTGRRDQASE